MLLTKRPRQTDIPEQPETVLSRSSDSDDRSMANASPECPICMSEIKLGQIISWSSNPQCIHGT
jgi:hypothetical protein